MAYNVMIPMLLNKDTLLQIHRKAILSASHDESSFLDSVRDEATLEFIIERSPRSADPMERATSFLWCIANWHPFVEGNKRTAWLAAQCSLDREIIVCDDASKFDQTIRSIASGVIPEDEVYKTFEHSRMEFSGDPIEYVLHEQGELLAKLSE